MTKSPMSPSLDIHSPAWTALTELQKTARDVPLAARFDDDPERAARYSLEAGPLQADLSRNHLDDGIVTALLRLAEERRVAAQVQALMAGETVNTTENRSAAHNRLRQDAGDGNVREMFARMNDLVRTVRDGERRGATGKPFRHVVNIGIGGSDFGPRLLCESLRYFTDAALQPHFVANIDPASLARTLREVDPETALFVVSSKSFGTQETLTNARRARQWLQQQLPDTDIDTHFVAVTSKGEKAEAFGITPDSIIPLPEWVGGRFSVWSAIGVPVALAFGSDTFDAFRSGGAEIDRHMQEQPPERCLPLLLGLLDVWYNNCWGWRSLAVLPYDHTLHLLPTYLQQLFMESTGKSVDRNDHPLPVHSCPVIWGSEGTNAQHSFFQMLHQGTDIVPCDFLLPLRSNTTLDEQHRLLVANCLGQGQALMAGKSEASLLAELRKEGVGEERARSLARHKRCPGNRPSTTITFERTSARSIGALIAMYEYRMFVAGAVWNINAYDQWGVELGKKVSESVAAALAGDEVEGLDGATRLMVERYRKKR